MENKQASVAIRPIQHHGQGAAFDLMDSPLLPASDGHVVRRKEPLTGVPHQQSLFAHTRDIAVHVMCLSWIVPMAVLLWLNYSKHPIGASAWCPFGNCNVYDAYGKLLSPNALTSADTKSHNLNGVLLIVAKILEIWFTAIASLLVWDMTLLLAKAKGGLPVGYLLMSLTFEDLCNSLSPSFWRPSRPLAKNKRPQDSRAGRILWLPVIAVILMLLVNLMGPASGVLILPTLQWLNSPSFELEQFEGLSSSEPPTVLALQGCSSEMLSVDDYSCTQPTYGDMLDDCLKTYANMNFTSMPVTYEGGVYYLAGNISGSDGLMNSPNRQALRNIPWNMLYDYQNFTLDLQLSRYGPAYQTMYTGYTGPTTSIPAGDDRQVLCRTADSIDPTLQRCIRVGSGWGISSIKNASFNLGDANSTVNVYFSDKALSYSDKTPSYEYPSDLSIPACMSQTATHPCDWDAIFDYFRGVRSIGPDKVEGFLSDRNLQVLEINSTGTWFESSTWLQSAIYTMDYARARGEEYFLDINYLAAKPEVDEPIVIDPAWILAAWSVNQSGTVDVTRAAAAVFLNATQKSDTRLAVPRLILAHALSLIPYDYTDLQNLNRALPQSGGSPKTTASSGPIIYGGYASLNIWAYGITSRTALLGVVVTALGILFVLARSILVFCSRHFYKTPIGKHPSDVDLLVAAMNYNDRGSDTFRGLHDENDRARVRVRLSQAIHGGEWRLSLRGSSASEDREDTAVETTSEIGTQAATGAATSVGAGSDEEKDGAMSAPHFWESDPHPQHDYQQYQLQQYQQYQHYEQQRYEQN